MQCPTSTSPRRSSRSRHPRKSAPPTSRPARSRRPASPRDPDRGVRFVGLTGAIAAGKSEALAAFARLGAATLSSDALAHELLEDTRVRERLVERWGGDVAP